MPRLPGWALLLFASVLAIIATYMAFGYIKGRTAVQSVKATIKVVRTIDPVEKGEILSAKQLKKVDWDQEALPKDRDYFNDEKQVEGRMAVESLPPNALITAKNTEPVVPGMAGKISHGKRAMTVKVDEASGVASSLTPGNRVDVVLIMDKGEYANDPLATTLFQNLKVLGTGQNTVTLEVTPEQGERLTLAAVEGRISLVLRRQLQVEPPGADASMLKTVPGTTALLSPNQRAITVKVDKASGVAPGNRVDVVLLLNAGAWEKYPVAKILLQNIEVLGTDKKQRVTLVATPQEAVDLIWAAQVGQISLVPRSGDKTSDKNKEQVWTSARRVLGNLDQLLPPRTLQALRGVEMGVEVPLDNKYRSASVPTAAVRR